MFLLFSKDKYMKKATYHVETVSELLIYRSIEKASVALAD